MLRTVCRKTCNSSICAAWYMVTVETLAGQAWVRERYSLQCSLYGPPAASSCKPPALCSSSSVAGPPGTQSTAAAAAGRSSLKSAHCSRRSRGLVHTAPAARHTMSRRCECSRMTLHQCIQEPFDACCSDEDNSKLTKGMWLMRVMLRTSESVLAAVAEEL